jgi:ribosome-associated protein
VQVKLGFWKRQRVDKATLQRTVPAEGLGNRPPPDATALLVTENWPMDDPMEVLPGVSVPLSEITVRAARSSGPGGQHANVTASRITAVFDVIASTALNEEQKQRVIDRLGPRVVAVAQDERGQSRNRELALERLRSRLRSALVVAAPRTPTRPTRASRERRLDDKRTQSERKRRRQNPEVDD